MTLAIAYVRRPVQTVRAVFRDGSSAPATMGRPTAPLGPNLSGLLLYSIDENAPGRRPVRLEGLDANGKVLVRVPLPRVG
jgi:hypothetical protein